MIKDAYYFPHDYNATQDHKILRLISKCGLAGLGAYWIIIEILHQQPDSKIPKDVFKSHIKMYYDITDGGINNYDNICLTLVETGLLTETDDFVSSERVNRNKKHRELISQQRSLAGKISANKRFGTFVKRAVEQNETKERKGKEIKVNKSKEENTTTASPEAACDTTTAFLSFCSAYKDKVGKDYIASHAKDKAILKDLLKLIPLAELNTLINRFFHSEDEFIAKSGWTVGVFKSQINKLRGGDVPVKKSALDKWGEDDKA